MRTGTAKTAAVALWLCAVVVLHGAKVKTSAEADPKFSFRDVKTWAWDPTGAGDVIMARSSKDDPAPVKERNDSLIIAALEREIGARGWTPAAGAPPDVTMHYYLLVTIGIDAQRMGQFLPPVMDWGIPPFAPATQSLNIITRGSIVLDLKSRSLDRIVWRGIAQTDMDVAPSDKERVAIINEAARELVKRIPKK
jgi:hypothetical protein